MTCPNSSSRAEMGITCSVHVLLMFIWGFSINAGVPLNLNGWSIMENHHSNGWFGGTPILRNLGVFYFDVGGIPLLPANLNFQQLTRFLIGFSFSCFLIKFKIINLSDEIPMICSWNLVLKFSSVLSTKIPLTILLPKISPNLAKYSGPGS